jgi:hypothetical protein
MPLHTPRISQVASLAGAFVGFVVLTNLSLRFNSVGIYQVITAIGEVMS